MLPRVRKTGPLTLLCPASRDICSRDPRPCTQHAREAGVLERHIRRAAITLAPLRVQFQRECGSILAHIGPVRGFTEYHDSAGAIRSMAVSRWRSNTGFRRPTPATACATQSPRPLLRSCHGGGLRRSQGADRLRQHRKIQLKAVGKRVLQRFAVSFDRAARMGRSRFKAVGQAYGPSFSGMLERSGARSAPEDQDCSGSRRSGRERHAYRCAVRQQHRMILHRCQQIVEQAIRCTVCATRRSGA